MKTYATFDDYLADQPRANQAMIVALRKFVKRAAPALAESVKWGNGCWVKGMIPVSAVRLLHGIGPEDPISGF